MSDYVPWSLVVSKMVDILRKEEHMTNDVLTDEIPAEVLESFGPEAVKQLIEEQKVSDQNKVDPKEVRAWAVVNGHPELAGKRGRLPKTVIAEFVAKAGRKVEEAAEDVKGEVTKVAKDVNSVLKDLGNKFPF